MNVNERPKALFRVRYTDPNNDATYHEFYTTEMWQVRNAEELHSRIYVEVAVPVWAPLTGV